MRVLITGANGMIGSTMFRILAANESWKVTGSIRGKDWPPGQTAGHLIRGINLVNPDHLSRLFRETAPDVVVNCAGLTKRLQSDNEPIPALEMNALLPHRLAEFCSIAKARLIHVSTDCVFSGKKGNYREDDQPDATDIYGRTKYLGEIAGAGLVTLRTSTIGHELNTRYGLLEWFLGQKKCKGYQKAIFSGLPSREFARIVRDLVIPDQNLEGLYHVSATPIDKDSLLRLIARIYNRPVEIDTDDQVIIDRSLNSEKFSMATGYRAPDWPSMIEAMYKDSDNYRQD